MATGAERIAAYRARQKAAGKADSSRARRKVHDADYKTWNVKRKPFTGCDGEGCGTDHLGRQLYMLFRMGERELFTGSHLTTEELLDFICDHPGDDILVGFSFGYDVTMILRDLPASQLDRLFQPLQVGEGKSRYTWFKQFDIEYLPKQYFRVRRCRYEIEENAETGEQKRRRVPVKNSSRTIFETFGFFQKSFVKVLNEFEIGTKAQRDMIAANKARRSDFDGITQEERDYCALECELLAALMEQLREYCDAAGIKPRSWNGAGKLASALHKQHETPRAESLSLPAGLTEFANMAYYGGRFEISRTGMIDAPVYEYDIRSAYPDAMRDLPCIVHGAWRKAGAKELAKSKALHVAAIRFNHADQGAGQLCGFPVRSREGHLYWPLQGGGVYWSCEIESARLLSASVEYRGGWIYEKQCDCHAFDWVEPLFDYRRSIGSSGPGYPIKLGINSLYGKLAQRKGAGPYANMIWAGLITALTRAKINRAAAQAPGQIAMVATDGIYSLAPLDLPEGEKLGQWEAQTLPGLFIVQPGLYWCPEKRKRKSRGLPGKFFEEPGMTEGFENSWAMFKAGALDAFPSHSVPLTTFVGLKLAMARGKPELAGTWLADSRTISFDYRNKREGHIWEENHIVTAPKPGGADVLSLPHKDFLKAGGAEPWENARAMLDEQPDYIDLSPPFMD